MLGSSLQKDLAMTLERSIQLLPMIGALIAFGVFCAWLGVYSFGTTEQIVVQVTHGACYPGEAPMGIAL